MNTKTLKLTWLLCLFFVSTHAQWTTASGTNNIYYTTGNVSIGTTTPTSSGLNIGTQQGVALSIGNTSWANTYLLQTGWDNVNGDYSDIRVPGATSNTSVLRLTRTGLLGVNTTTPNQQGGISVGTTEGVALSIGNPNWASQRIIQTGWDNVNGDYTDIRVPGASANNALLRINSLGAILIGKTTSLNSAYLIDVAGIGRFNQVIVNTSGADFVFDPTYRLPDLQKVEAYLLAHHHLEGIAPAADMQANGLDLGENQIRQLQKIEELTLYSIRQDKTIKAQQQQLEQQDVRLKDLEARLLRLEQRE